MADSILRLRVDSQEYDNKLKRAAEGIQRYAEGCRKAGGTLTQLDEGVEQFVKELGNMEAVSNSARGKINEMTKAFTELSVQYNKLTDEEKASPFGKALSESLNTLKGRIQEGKTELDDINKSLNGGGGLSGALDAVAGKFGLSIEQVTKFGSVLGVATTAAQVAKDAFFQSESGIDEWGRTVEGAKGAYNIFLDTLNNGNWSNFFQNLQTAIQGGRDLYDIFDRLGSIKSNNAAAIAMVQQQIAQLRLAKQQGENVDAQLKEATARLAQLQKQSITAGMAAGNKSAFEVIRNGVNSVGGARYNDATINYVIGNIMKNGQSEFDKYRNNYQTLRNRGMVTKTQTIYDSQGGTYERQYKEFDINALTKEQQKQYSLAKAITEGETRIQKGIAAYAQAVQEGTASAREEFKGNRYALQGSGGSGSGKGDVGGPSMPKNIRWDNYADKAAMVKPEDFIAPPSVWEQYAEGIKGTFGTIKDSMSNLTNWTKDFDPFNEYLEQQNKLLQEQQTRYNLAGQAASNFGAALAGLDDPAAKAAGTVMQAIASIAMGFAMASSNANTAGTGWGWLAWLAAGTAAMATTISTIHSLTGYAQGGMIKGNSYSGDNIGGLVDGSQLVGLNAGEIVLNAAGQQNVAANLRGGALSGMRLQTKVKGTELLIWVDNALAQSGRGELVTWGQ